MINNHITIQRQKRRSISLTIETDGHVKIKAPLNTSEKQIQNVIEKKRNWIKKKSQLILQTIHLNHKKTFHYQDQVLYLGTKYTLMPSNNDSNTKIYSDAQYIYIPKCCNLTKMLELWFKENAKDILIDRASELSKQIGLKFNQCRIKKCKSRWGSCSSKKNINLNWKLVHTPWHVIDYVIIHELCHLQELNHSKKFWDLVESYYPNYKESIKWLKRYSHCLI